jgi:Na+/glutamate symporter
MKKTAAMPVVLLLGWVLGILLPMHAFRRFSPSYRTAFDWVFRTHASHVLMHTFLYAVLACLLASFLRRSGSSSGRVFAWTLAAVAAVAALQEAIQMVCGHVALGSDEMFDFFVDLNGGLLGTMLFAWRSRRRMRSGLW